MPHYRLINFPPLTVVESGKLKDMGFLFVSICVAIAAAVSVYIASASLVLAFVAYAAAGSLTLISALIADGLVNWDKLD